jgi:oxalate decarboxylase/phosphoglucose isomerase-like protein (cupin superfamily)
MKMRRIVTAESKSGVVVQASDLLETTTADLATNIWGFDQLPTLPVAAEQVLGEYRQKGLFGPKGSVRVDVLSIPPESGSKAPDFGPLIAKLDLGTGHNMTPGKSGGGMHRTDGIDLVVVISGEGDMAYPGEDGQLKEVHLKAGDFIAQNGNFHEWRNRSGAHFVILIVVLGAERKAS